MDRTGRSKELNFDNGFETVLNSISEVFFLLDEKYHFLYLNPKAKDFFQLNRENISDVSIWDVFPFEKSSKLSDILIHAFLEKEKISGEFYSSAHSRWFKITAYSSNNGIAAMFSDIHEEKIEQEDLRKSEQTLRLILDFIPHIAFILNEKAEVLFLNKRWTEYTGRSLEEGLGEKWGEMIHFEDYLNKLKTWQEKAPIGEPFETEFRVKNKKGEYRWHSDRLVPIPPNNGSVGIWVGTATDIHDLKIYQEKLEEAEIIAETGSFEYEVATSKMNLSPGAFRLLGLLPGSLEPDIEFLDSITLPNGVLKIGERIEEIIADKKPFECVWRIVRPNGDIRCLQNKGKVICNDKQEVEKLVGILHDITEQLKAEIFLKEKINLINKISEATPDLITVIDIDALKITYSNTEVKTFAGYNNEEFIAFDSLGIKERIYPEDWPAFEKFFKDFHNAKDSEVRELEHRARDADENLRWFKIRSKVFQRNSDEEVTHVISITQDITEKKLAEKEIKEHEHFIKEVAEASPDLIIVYNFDKGKISYVNQDEYSNLGYQDIELQIFSNQEIQQKIHQQDWHNFKNYHNELKAANDEEIKEIEFRAKSKKGKWKWLRERGKVFQRNEHGEVTHFIAIIQEITARKAAEEKQRQNEVLNKLVEKKDEFMSVASHELKTPITTLKASMQVLKRLVEKHADEKTLMVFISKAVLQVNKLVSLISDLMDNAKIQAGKLGLNIAPFSLNELIEECILQNSNQHKIIVRNSVTDEIEGDKVRLEQVLTNFINNAIKYSPQENEIIVEAAQENGFVKVSVKDFGIGIPKEKLDHIFDRFYRVEEKSQEFSGLGLGLYISAEIIKKHRGKYGVSSKLGKGSTFWFKIPVKH